MTIHICKKNTSMAGTNGTRGETQSSGKSKDVSLPPPHNSTSMMSGSTVKPRTKILLLGIERWEICSWKDKPNLEFL